MSAIAELADLLSKILLVWIVLFVLATALGVVLAFLLFRSEGE